jgi:hypothetical protein
VIEHTLQPGETVFELPVTVREGIVDFSAQVFSNNGTLLYAGQQREEIHRDGFSVTLLLDTMNAVMLASPDMLDLRTTPNARVFITNAGNQPLTWSITAQCDTMTLCIIPAFSGHELNRSRVDTLPVNGYLVVGAPESSMRIHSNVGTIDLPVLVGRDITPPVATIKGMPDSSVNSQQRDWQIDAVDPGAPASGLPTHPSRVVLSHLFPSGATCYSPDAPFTGRRVDCFTQRQTPNYVPDDGLMEIGLMQGYWMVSGFAVDRAGNVSDTVSRITLIDTMPPVVGRIRASSPLAGGASMTFTSDLYDNVDLGTLTTSLDYDNALTFESQSVTLGRYGAADGFIPSTLGDTTMIPFMHAVEGTTTRGRSSGAVNEAMTFRFEVRDVAGHLTTETLGVNAAVRSIFQNGVPALSAQNPRVFAPRDTMHGNFTHLPPSNATVCRGGPSACRATPANTTLRVAMTVPSGTSNPFVRVEFYWQDPLNGRWNLIGTASFTTTDDSITRIWTYSYNWNVTGLLQSDRRPLVNNAVNLLAVGIHSSSALMSTGTRRTIAITGS